jgi:hypothetical protein
MVFLADTVLSQTESGLAGEYIAAASVVGRGWRVAMAQQDAVDLVAWHPETSEILRIQVKSCQASRSGKDGKRTRVHFQTGIGGKKRLPTRHDYDVLACVSAEQRTVWFVPVTEIDCKKFTLHTDFFISPKLEKTSWAHALDVLGVNDGR